MAGAVYRLRSGRFAVLRSIDPVAGVCDFELVDVHRVCPLPDGDMQLSMRMFATASLAWTAAQWRARMADRRAHERRMGGQA